MFGFALFFVISTLSAFLVCGRFVFLLPSGEAHYPSMEQFSQQWCLPLAKSLRPVNNSDLCIWDDAGLLSSRTDKLGTNPTSLVFIQVFLGNSTLISKQMYWMYSLIQCELFFKKNGGRMHCRITQKFSELSGYLFDLMLR